MEDLGVKLHPVNRLQVWRAIKNEVFGKMGNGMISAERADEILAKIKREIAEVKSPEQAKQFYLALPQIYPELSAVTHKFRIQEAEALDKLLTLLLSNIEEKGDSNLAGDFTEKISASEDYIRLFQEMEKKYPAEFQSCLKKFFQGPLLK